MDDGAMLNETWRWPVLHSAQRAVLLDLLVHGSRSRADLARRTGLSRGSLTRLTRDLIDLGLVQEGDTAQPKGRGRPGESLSLLGDAAHFVGIKLTGGHLYAVVTDLRAQVKFTRVYPLASRVVDAVVEQVAGVVSQAQKDFSKVTAVGVCLAGDVQEHPGGAVLRGSHFLGWDDVPLESIMSAKLGIPTWISNDVQALTMAHQWFGGGVGHDSLAVVGLGEGIGAGIVANGSLIGGAGGHPGKVGHIRVSSTGPSCDRGHVGCVSAFVTAPALLRNSGISDYSAVFAAARSGHPEASEAVNGAVKALATVIAHLQNLVDPEKIIVTGEGVPVARFDPDGLHSAVRAGLDPAADDVTLDVHDFEFADYAWGAAIRAIRGIISREGTA